MLNQSNGFDATIDAKKPARLDFLSCLGSRRTDTVKSTDIFEIPVLFIKETKQFLSVESRLQVASRISG